MPRKHSPLRWRRTPASALLALAAVCAVVWSLLPRGADQPRPAAPPEAHATNAPAPDPAQRAKIDEAYGRLPLSFEANEGQVAGGGDVKFVSRGQGYTLFLTPTEAVLALRGRGEEERAEGGRQRTEGRSRNESFVGRRGTVDEGRAESNGSVRASATANGQRPTAHVVLRMSLVGANAEPRVRGAAELPGKSNYFIGDDPARWRANVGHFAAVEYAEVYPGVDLVYYGNQRQLEYDFRLAPGADPSRIALKFTGAERVELDAAGELVLHTSGGEVRQHKPFVYQTNDDGERREVASGYSLRGTTEVGFELGAYDPSRPLIIDPTLVYSSYLGGTGLDFATGVAVDTSGNVYLAGFTGSTNFPVQGAFQPANAGNADGFVTKINAAGTALVYSTYVGGADFDQFAGIALDDSGAAYVTGASSSTDYPLQNPLQAVNNGGGGDVVLTKLAPAGNALVYSTYLGGAALDAAHAVAVDANRDVYLTGQTTSADFPSQNPFQASLNGTSDSFVTKFNDDGTTLVYSTYLGGSAGNENGQGIAADADGNAYVVGVTPSTDFPTQSPFQAASGGGGDGFVAKLNPTGDGLVYSTYLGGATEDAAHGIALDSSANAYVAGQTDSANFPTQAPFQAAFAGGISDAFVTTLNAAGNALEYSTYLGGSDEDYANDIVVGQTFDRAYVVGSTVSTDFPTQGATQAVNNGGGDAFVTQFDAAGGALLFSTFFGGTGTDYGNAVAVSSFGLISVVGETGSTDLPTQSPFQPADGGTSDAFVARLFPFSVFTVTNTNDAGAGSLRAAITAANAAAGPDIITFNIPGAGPHTISPGSPLPAITDPVVVDGYTQPGSSENTLAVGNDAVILVELDGAGAGAGANGLRITAGGSTVRGLAVLDFDGAGLLLQTADGNLVQGNFVGLGSAGTAAPGAGNVNGVVIEGGSSNNLVGGAAVGARNVISGNDAPSAGFVKNGVIIRGTGTDGNAVRNNYVGTNPAGTAALPNGNIGIFVTDGPKATTVGGEGAADRNVISGNQSSGVVIAGAGTDNNRVGANYIGTNAAGTASLGTEQETGVNITNGAKNNTVGGATAGERNVISGTGFGVSITNNGTTGNFVRGNYIGTDAGGAVAVANSQTGVAISFDASGNTVGGPSAADRNVISGHSIGVFISGAGGNVVQGNFVGTDASGAGAVLNTGIGVFAGFGSNNNLVGGTGAGAGNLIAFNGGDGVNVGAGVGNAVLSNSIHSNGATAADLGIDLDPDGLTTNDAGDADTGPNNLQNFPVVSGAVTSGGVTNVTGALNSTASTQFRVEFFSNPSCDTAGNGEGRTFLGFQNVSTDGSGNAPFNTMLAPAVAPGEFVTATATDPANNTSEFSPCALVTPPSAGSVQFDAANYSVNENAGTVTLTVTRTGGASGAVTVAYTDTPGTAANPADYSNATGTVTFLDGDAAPKTFNVTINSDALDEDDETFGVALSIFNGAAVVGTPGTASVTINDDDAPPTISIGDASVNEGDAGTQSLAFTVTLSAASGKAVGVAYATADQTATAGADYDAANGTVNIAAGVTSAAFNVSVRGDTADEPNETFLVNLSAPTDATIGDAQSVGTINDDDVGPVAITGRVFILDGAQIIPVANVNVTLSGSQQRQTTTDAVGNYAFNNLATGGSYTVTPSEVSYVFAPSSRSFNNLAANETADFTASVVNNLSFTGRVVDSNGNGLPNVTLTVSGALSLVAETDATGNYSLQNVPANASFTVTPDREGFSFAPPSRAFAAVTSSQTGADFNGTLQPTPTPTPDPDDDFTAPVIDPTKWNTGVLTQPAAGFDPFVQLGQPDGRLEITPRAEANGRSFNGYVSRVAVDLSITPVVSIEAIQPATGPGVQTIFALGKDKDNFFRFLVEDSPASPFAPPQGSATDAARAEAMPTPAPQTISFQTTFNGVKFASSVEYSNQQHRHWRFRYEAPAQKVHLETSPDRDVWTTRLTADLGRDQTRLIAELSAGSFGPLTAPTVAIFDNYSVAAPTRLQFSSPAFDAPENGGPVAVTVTRAGALDSPTTVAYATTAGTATDGADYRHTSGTLRFEIGETQKSFAVPVLDDDVAEGPETVNLALSNVAGGTLGANARAVLSIGDDDSASNPIDDSTVFVTAHYRDFLNREPDAAGLAFWVGGIESCGDDRRCREAKRVDTSAAFFLSIEFQRTGFVAYRFYDAAFERFPDFRAEFLPDAQALGEGVVVGQPGFEARLQRNQRAFAAAFVRRAAFRARYDALNSADYVDALYRNAGVAPAPEERVALIAELVTGRTTRADVLVNVVEEADFIRRELNRAFVLMQYFGYLRRNPNDAPDTNLDGYFFWLSKLEQFDGNYVEAEMVKAFILSIEYRRRFGRT